LGTRETLRSKKLPTRGGENSNFLSTQGKGAATTVIIIGGKGSKVDAIYRGRQTT